MKNKFHSPQDFDGNQDQSIGPNLSQKTICLVQITRIGDVLQTIKAASEFKKIQKNYRIILICREQFGLSLEFLLKDVFDYVYLLPTQKLKQDLTGQNQLKIRETFTNFLANLHSRENISALVNLSYSRSSNYLASLIKAEHKIGPYFDSMNGIRIHDKWSTYLYSHVLTGANSPYNLVDLFKNIIGISQEQNHESSTPAIETLKHNKTEQQKNIVIHPFASQDRKMWKPEKWVEIIYKILRDQKDFKVTLVGSKDEVLKSRLIAENPLLKTISDRITNKVGLTSIRELYEILKTSTIFVGHDSMVSHLASFANIQILTISLGSVRPHETIPYQVNAYSIAPKTKCFPCFPDEKCQYFQCHMDVPHQSVIVAINQLIKNNQITIQSFKEESSSFHLGSLHLYRTQMNQFSQLVINEIVENSEDAKDVMRTLNRICYSYMLNGMDEVLPFPKLNSNSHNELYNSLQGVQHLFELCEFGMKYSKFILEEISSNSPSITKIKELSKKIDEVDELIKMIKKTEPMLSAFIDYTTIRKANLFGENIVNLTESSYLAYEETYSLMKVLYELIEKTLVEHKTLSSKITNV